MAEEETKHYRLLNAGDKVREGAEWQNHQGHWLPWTPPHYGQVLTHHHVATRVRCYEMELLEALKEAEAGLEIALAALHGQSQQTWPESSTNKALAAARKAIALAEGRPLE